MEWLAQLVLSTPEYRSWGYNLATGSFLLTVALTFGLQLPGLVNQARMIWKNRSAEGVELLTFIAFFTYFAVFCVYAFATRSGAGMVNTWALLVPQIVILAGIVKYSQARWIDAVAGLAGLCLVALAVIQTEKQLYFTIASVAVFVGLALQPIAMTRTQTSKNVAISFPLGFAFVCAVWTVYGTAIGDFYIAGASFAFMLEYLAVVALWFKYREI